MTSDVIRFVHTYSTHVCVAWFAWLWYKQVHTFVNIQCNIGVFGASKQLEAFAIKAIFCKLLWVCTFLCFRVCVPSKVIAVVAVCVCV